MASGFFNKGLHRVLNQGLTGLTIKVMLVTSGYTFNRDHDFVSDGPAANELSGTGYVAGFAGSGRKTLASVTIAEDDANDRAYLDAADLTWTGINAGTAQAAIVYINGTADADSILLAYIDSGGFPKATNGSDLVINWSNSPLGVFQATG